ncbi:MAG: dockerin type I domain-containing protein [Aquimonas sp.]|nr:dockerin type I domain-containing protein [Aquimonas sp.]
MKTVTTSILAAAVLMALPYASAEACNNSAWNGNTSAANSTTPAGPASATPQRRYGGLCSLQAAASGGFVTDNTPSSEALYQARFYVFTPAGGTAQVFRTTTANANGGTQVFAVEFTGTSFTFPGSGAAAITGIQAGRWYGVEVTNNTTANTFAARVRGAGNNTVLTSNGTAAAGSVTSASLGFISGTATGAVVVDDFESTRSATSIGFLCKGDTNADGVRTVADAGRIRNEFLNPTLAATTGQPDFNEDGAVTIADAGLVQTLFLSGQGACPTS